MKHALGWVLVLVPGIIIAILLLLRSPTYGGRSVHSWIKDLGKSGTSEENDRARAKATEALLEIGPNAVPALVKARFSKESPLDKSLDWLESNAPAFLARRLPERPDRDSIRQYSLETLIALGPDAKQAIPKFKEAYLAPKKDITEQVEAVSWAEALLAAAGKEDPALCSFFIGSLSSADGDVVFGALFALGEIGPAARDAVPKLIGLLDVDNERIQWRAAEALRQIGLASSNAVPALRKLMLDEKAYLDARVSAASSIWRITAETNPTLPLLTSALGGGGLNADAQAAEALGEMGKVAEPALPALLETLSSNKPRSEEEWFKVRVAEAIWRINPEADAVLPTLVRELHGRAHREAFEALGTLGTAARAAIPELLVALQGEDHETRKSATIALGNVGSDAREAVPALIKALDDDFISVRLSAAEALTRIDPQNAQLPRTLNTWLRTGGTHTQRCAAELFARIALANSANVKGPQWGH
jgi:HEAT repeat protein